MSRSVLTAAVAVLLSCLATAPAGAISGGTPDQGHRYAGMLGVQDDDGRWFGQCSGFFGGDGTFVTAAHCLDWLEADGISAGDLGVTFDPEITWSAAGDAEVVSDNEWHPALAYAFHGDLDYGAVRLASVPSGLQPPAWPAVGRLDAMRVRGGLHPRTVFDSVGYGLVPGPSRGQNTDYEFAPGRMLATSRFQTLSDDWLRLNANNHIKNNGGPCLGDSGGPTLIHGTDTVVAFSAGGHKFCWGYATNLRLDTEAARDFYGELIDLG